MPGVQSGMSGNRPVMAANVSGRVMELGVGGFQ